MIKGIDGIMLSSAGPKKLAKFYESIGVTIGQEWEMGDKQEPFFEMKLGSGSGFYIAPHSKVKGQAKDPHRIILNFEVDDIESMVDKLKKLKVNLVADAYHIEGYGQVATFADIDGNIFQLVQVKAK